MHFAGRLHIASPLIVLLGTWCAADERPPLTRPVAVVNLASTSHVATANRSGTISVVDLEAGQVIQETRLGKQLADLVAIPRYNDYFLTVDEAAHELIAVRINDERTTALQRLSVSAYPVSIATTSDGATASVASLWSRRLTIVNLGEAMKLAVERVIDLPFAPRKQIALPDNKQLIVFDSFGGRLAVVEIATGRIVLQREFPGHAVRGLALSPDRQMLLAAHQMLNPHGHANQNDIHWGLVMNNDLRWMKLSHVLDSTRELYAGGRVQPLGIPGRGGADPGGVAVGSDGVVAVCLGGVDQVMIGSPEDATFKPVRVGRRPTAVAISSDGNQAVVANTFGDSLSIVDLAERRVAKTIPLSVTRERTRLERGEELFYDSRFSHEGWMSCHSCHTDGHSNFTANDNLSDGGFGAPKLVISLLGRKGTAPFAWEGTASDMLEQVRDSIHKTMQADYKQTAEEDVAALAEYVESLPSPPSVEELRGTADRAAIARGRTLFEKHDCANCHAPPDYTVSTLQDAGIGDELGHRKFNPPTLRGVGQRDALLHDGRARSIRDVFLKADHPQDRTWSEADVDDLVSFLRGL